MVRLFIQLRGTRPLWVALVVSALLAACSSNPPAPRISPASGGTVPVKDPSHPALAVATRMLGTPYRYGGSSPRGFDCSGLVYYAYHQTGVPVPRTTRAQQRHARPVFVAHIQPGDLLFFRHGKRAVAHVGIYSGHSQFIHAPSSGKRVSYARLDNPYWQQRLVGAGRY